MKVRCINNESVTGMINLTVGKIYSVLKISEKYYSIKNDKEYIVDYSRDRFEEVEEVEKEKVLEVEFQDVFDKVAWKITYQNTSILKRDVFRDKEIGVVSHFAPYFDGEILFIQGFNDWKDNEMNIASKEEAEIIKRKVDAINEKYGLIKRWRAKIGEAYYYIDSDGTIALKEEYGTTMDDGRYKFGNYAKTKEELEFKKLEKIKQILQGE